MSKPKENSDITLHCTTCGMNHTIMKLGALKEKIPDLDLKTTHYKHGLCKECDDHLKAGGVFFVDRSGRCVKVSEEASREKISEGFRGKVILVPAAALNELIKCYLESNSKPPVK